jgi:ferredoxin
MCYLLAPELFEVDDDGRGSVVDPKIDERRVAGARIAVDRCPERAVSLSEV